MNGEYLAVDGVALQGYCDRHAQHNRKHGNKLAGHEWVQWRHRPEGEVVCVWCGRLRREAQETRPLAFHRPLLWGYYRNFAAAESVFAHVPYVWANRVGFTYRSPG